MTSPFETLCFLIPISSGPLFMIAGLILFNFPPKDKLFMATERVALCRTEGGTLHKGMLQLK
jgi:hypothetical protein